MRLDLDSERLGRLFPAYLVVGGDGMLRAWGPAVARHCPQVAAGRRLDECFAVAGSADAPDLARLAQGGGDLQLRARSGGLGLCGSVIAAGDEFLLALAIAPSSFDIADTQLQLSDLAPNDPRIQGMMLVRLQKAMLEESREIAGELAQARQRSHDLLDRVSRAAGYMAHDFNNLLSIIKLNGDRLLESPVFGAAQRRMVRIMMEVADRGSEITRSLMTLSHQRHDSRTRLELDRLIVDNLTFLSSLAGARVEVTTALGAGGAVIDVSRTGLMNCLVNLLVNSRDAMPDGGRITLATQVRAVSLDGGPPRDHVAIRLSDSGSGMTEAVLLRAFEPLFSTKTHGSGIGLASVLEFAREMDGDACLDSVPGEGTSVYIYLPAAAAEAGNAAATTPQPAADGAGAHVLIVEDEPYALEALVEMVEALGCRVTAAADADAAMAALRAEACALMLTDVVLPGASGLELAAWAEAAQPGLGVILMSGYVPDAQQMHAGWAFIRKPLDTGRLRALIVARLGSAGVTG